MRTRQQTKEKKEFNKYIVKVETNKQQFIFDMFG